MIRKRRTGEVPNELQPFTAKTLNVDSPRYFLYGGFVYELTNESGNLITGVDRNPTLQIGSGGRTTVNSKVVQILPKDNILTRFYYVLLQRRKLLVDEDAIKEIDFAISGIESAIRDLHYVQLSIEGKNPKSSTTEIRRRVS